MDEKVLREIGLSPIEIKVYLALLKVESATAAEISEKVGIYRTNTYDVFQSLIEKGLVAHIKKTNRKHFFASKPQKLLDYVNEKEEKLAEQKIQVQHLIPLLIQLKQPGIEELHAEIYRGKEGLKTILNNVLREAKIVYYLGYSGISKKVLPYFWIHWHKHRIKRKIKRMIITKEQMRGTEEVNQPLTDVRFIKDDYNSPISMMIFNNKVWILIPSDNDHVSLVIESKSVSQSFLNYFNQLWKTAEK